MQRAHEKVIFKMIAVFASVNRKVPKPDGGKYPAARERDDLAFADFSDRDYTPPLARDALKPEFCINVTTVF